MAEAFRINIRKKPKNKDHQKKQRNRNQYKSYWAKQIPQQLWKKVCQTNPAIAG